jgi:hypothetical protein
MRAPRKTKKSNTIADTATFNEKKFAFHIKGTVRWVKVPEAIEMKNNTIPYSEHNVYSMKLNFTEKMEERLIADNASQAFFILGVFRYLQSAALIDGTQIIETVEVKAP